MNPLEQLKKLAEKMMAANHKDEDEEIIKTVAAPEWLLGMSKHLHDLCDEMSKGDAPVWKSKIAEKYMNDARDYMWSKFKFEEDSRETWDADGFRLDDEKREIHYLKVKNK